MRIDSATFDAGTAHEAAMDWAAGLVRRIDQMNRDQMNAAWNSLEAQAHRAQLKTSGPEALRQLAGAMRERLGCFPD